MKSPDDDERSLSFTLLCRLLRGGRQEILVLGSLGMVAVCHSQLPADPCATRGMHSLLAWRAGSRSTPAVLGSLSFTKVRGDNMVDQGLPAKYSSQSPKGGKHRITM